MDVSSPAAALPPRTFGGAWLALAIALALHVADEAAHDFLAFYNPAVTELVRHLPWLWLPTFTFPVWIAGLAAGVALLLALTPLAFRGRSWLRWPAFALAALMLGNGLLHLAGSVVLGRLVPGFWSAPLLLLASAWLLVATGRPDGRQELRSG